MARRVFFIFHHQQDSWRVAQVRKSWLTKCAADNFLDAVEWEAIARKGDAAIKRWINEQLHGTSVTAILIGSHTATRPYVRYEIEQSIAKGNGLLGIYIHGIKDQEGRESERGRNPLDDFEVSNPSPLTNWLTPRCRASWAYNSYFWYDDNGRDNLTRWIEEAAALAGRTVSAGH